VGIDFHQPLYLLLLVPALFVVVQWWRKQTRLNMARRTVIAVVRALVFLFLILALAGTQLLYPVQAETVIFVVDRSASMKDDSRLAAFVQEAVRQKRSIDQFGVVSVAQTAGVEQPITTKPEVTPFGVEVGPHATNLAEGIRLAAGMIPSTARGKIVLLSDGLATHVDAATEISLAKQRGIAFEAVSLQQPAGNEVVLSSVQIPDRLYLGEQFDVKVDIESTIATKATLRLYEGNQEISRQTVAIEKGKNHFRLPEKSRHEGFHRYRVEIQPETDTIQVNNQAHAFTQVQGSPRVLIVEGEKGAGQNLANALQAGNIIAEVKEPALLPKELNDFKQYASIILANVDATQVKEKDMERIRTAVSDLGVGLIMTGGSSSFGMGGWFKTPVEEALPVYMDLRGKEKLPSLGLLLVIDKSGSMSAGADGIDKMEMAKEAAIRSTEMLNEQDQVGVVAFDGEPWVVVEPQPVANLSEIHDKIGGIYADGGTDIFPALQMAYEKIKGLKTQRKHVILLTDGQSGRDDDYQGLLDQMARENITVSTVAVGEDSDTILLEDIARMGKGRYYSVIDPGTIPTIFSKETALASRTFIVEKPQVPIRTGAGDWTALQEGIPPIHAYIATTAKQTAEQALASADSDPVLVRWQYGLGRSVAWTSDLAGKWSPNWVAWAGSGPLWNQIVSWTFPQVTSGEWRTETELDGLNGKITVSLPTGASMPQSMEAIVVNQNLEHETVRLKPIAPGKLSGEFSAAEPGTYMLQVVQKQGEKVLASQTAGLTISYSPEYGLRQDGEQRLQELAKAGDGQLIDDPEAVFNGQLPKKWESQLITELLLMLAALFWPLDIALRRLQIPDHWWEKAARLFRRRKQAEAAPSAAAAMISDLAETKKRVKPKRPVFMPEAAERQPQETAGPSTPKPSERKTQPSAARPVSQEEIKGSARTEQANGGQGKTDAFNRLLDAKKRKQK
jgi:Mg-chelatase subunit ChlD/uncharacterized membrane protein